MPIINQYFTFYFSEPCKPFIIVSLKSLCYKDKDCDMFTGISLAPTTDPVHCVLLLLLLTIIAINQHDTPDITTMNYMIPEKRRDLKFSLNHHSWQRCDRSCSFFFNWKQFVNHLLPLLQTLGTLETYIVRSIESFMTCLY